MSALEWFILADWLAVAGGFVWFIHDLMSDHA